MQQIGAESQVVRHWEKTQSSCSEIAKTVWGVVQVEHQNPLSVQIWWGMVQLLWTLWADTLWGLLWPLSPSSMNTKLGAGQKAEHFPSTQTRLHHRKAYLLQKIPGEEFVSQQELSNSPHPTLQLGTRSWVNIFSKRPATEVVQVPDSSTTTSIPVVTAPRPPAPGYFTPWPSTKSGMNTTEKGTQTWTAFGWNCECLHGKCTGML